MKVILRDARNSSTRYFFIEGGPLQWVRAYQALRPKNVTADRFFLAYRNGKCITQPLGKNKFGLMPKEIAEFLQLPNPQMYTGHAFRRSPASLCADQGKIRLYKY